MSVSSQFFINFSEEDSTYDVVKLQKQLEYWIDEPSRIRAIVFSGCDAIFDDLNHLTERNSTSEVGYFIYIDNISYHMSLSYDMIHIIYYGPYHM